MKPIPYSNTPDYYKFIKITYLESVKRGDKWLDFLFHKNESNNKTTTNPDIIAGYNYINTSELPNNDSLSNKYLKELMSYIPISLQDDSFHYLDIIVYNSTQVTGNCNPVFYIMEYLNDVKDTILFHVFDIFTLDYSSFNVSLKEVCSNSDYYTEGLPLMLDKSAINLLTQVITPSSNKHVKYLVDTYGFTFNTDPIESQIFSIAL